MENKIELAQKKIKQKYGFERPVKIVDGEGASLPHPNPPRKEEAATELPGTQGKAFQQGEIRTTVEGVRE